VTREAVHEPLRRALREGPFAMRQLAEECGLSYDVVRSWRSGRRRASPESIRRLAGGLERRAERLNVLAQELRAALSSGGGGGNGGGGAGEGEETERATGNGTGTTV
jgi:transcriptional regulator with XRE-family HTH domain